MLEAPQPLADVGLVVALTHASLFDDTRGVGQRREQGVAADRPRAGERVYLGARDAVALCDGKHASAGNAFQLGQAPDGRVLLPQPCVQPAAARRYRLRYGTICGPCIEMHRNGTLALAPRHAEAKSGSRSP